MTDVINFTLERLDLIEPAKSVVLELMKLCPEIMFTSGRRNRQQQAISMAENVMENRNWIGQTYVQSAASLLCQKWVNEHPVATREEIAAGLEEELEELTDDDVAHLSKHLKGLAFDVKPVSGIEGKKIREAIQTVVARHGGKFLEREGGLIRWHVQF